MNARSTPSLHESEALTALLRGHEEMLLDPRVRTDRARVAAFLADDFFEFGSSGKVWTREEILDLLEKEQYDPPAIESFECRLIAAGVALVTYRAVRTCPGSTGRGSTLRSSIWTEISGVWRLRFHQGTHAA